MFQGALGGVGADGEPLDIQTQLRDALARSGSRVIELFRQWDTDGDGIVSKAEFVRSLPQLGLQASNEALGALFDTFDPDGSGTIELKELEKMLRNRVGQLAGTAVMVGSAAAKLKSKAGIPSPPPGAKPTLGRKGSQKGSQKTLARGKSGMFQGALGGVGADGEPVDVQAQLRDALVSSGSRVIELFRQWDTDGDGTVSKKEFVRSLPQLGLQATKEEGGALFDTFDPDGSGSIELKELEKLLRRKAPAAGATKPTLGGRKASQKGSQKGSQTLAGEASAPAVGALGGGALAAEAQGGVGSAAAAGGGGLAEVQGGGGHLFIEDDAATKVQAVRRGQTGRRQASGMAGEAVDVVAADGEAAGAANGDGVPSESPE